MRVFVAGATGALGVPVVRRLVENGHEVAGLTRSAAKAAMLRDLGAAPVVADVLDAPSIKGAVAEAAPDGVVHALTALPKNGPMRAAHLKATDRLRITGTANLLAAALAAGARRILAESIVLVYGASAGARLATERTTVSRRVSGAFQPTQDALLSLEDQVLGASAKGEIEGIVLRYGMFYGPGVGSTEYMIRLLRRGLPMLPGGGNGVSSWIHVDDAASATVEALERGTAGEIYNVVDDEPVALKDFAAAISSATGGKPPRSLPMWIVRLAGPLLASSVNAELRVSNEKAKRELGWTPAHPTFRDGVTTLGR